MIVDVNNQPGTSTFAGTAGINDAIESQQQVTDVNGGTLAGVTLYTISGDDTDTVSIGVGNAFYTGAFAFTQTGVT